MKITHPSSSFPPFLLATVQRNEHTRSLQRSNEPPKNHEGTYVRPVITRNDMAATMDNMRAYIDQIDGFVATLNREVATFNRKVQRPGPVKKDLVAVFMKKYGDLDTEEFNERVDDFTRLHGKHIEKKKHQPLKPAAEIIFAAMVHDYSVELNKINRRRDRHGIHYPMTLPRMEVNPDKLKRHTRKGVNSLRYCKKTIRNHRSRMEKYGVLQDYEYHGSNHPVDYRVNPSILVVSEGENQKSQKTESQSLNPIQGKKVPHNDVDTRTLEEKQEIKGNVDRSTSPNADVAAQRPFKIVFYKNNQPQGAKNANQGPREICEKSARFLEKAVQDEQKTNPAAEKSPEPEGIPEILPTYELAAELSRGRFDHYVPIASEKLKRLATFSSYTLAEYREIILQDAIKCAARLWTKNHPEPGSWGNAIKLIYNEYKTLTPTGEAKNKAFMYQWLMEFRYRIRFALKWFTKRKWDQVRYPSIYFDPTRTDSSDVCFAFTAKAFVQNEKKKAQYRKLREQERIAGARKKTARKESNRYMQRMDAAIRKYRDGQYHIDDLLEAIAKLPDHVQEKFDMRFNELSGKR